MLNACCNEQHDDPVHRACRWKASCYALAAIQSWAARSTCFLSLLGFPGPNHLRATYEVAGLKKFCRVFEPTARRGGVLWGPIDRLNAYAQFCSNPPHG